MENLKKCREFIRNLLSIKKGHALLFSGSAFELPFQYVISNVTDVGIMYIPTDICALPVNVSAPHNFQGRMLVVTTEGIHPGFAKLCSPDCKRQYRWQSSIHYDHYKNGPAWTLAINNEKHTDIINSMFENLDSSQCRGIYRRLLEMKMDRVFAICCPCWPNEGDEWKTRERPNGWPTTEVVDKVVASGCYFVAKPHQSCPEDDTQWRFSFSQAEVILIHSWTDVQKYIYHILRLIKSDVVKACGESDETVLCTYFFKTLMFWECERKPKEFWEDKNVETSITELLCIIIGWLIDGCCPNYFIPDNNMISTSTERVDFSEEIQMLWIYINSVIHQLTKRNSILWPKASDLYGVIMSHLQLMKTDCPKRKLYLVKTAVHYFLSCLMDDADKCSKWFLSIDESIYEWLRLLNSATVCKVKPGRTPDDNCGLHFADNCQMSPSNIPYNCNTRTYSQFVRVYNRLEEREKDEKESVATSDNLTTPIKTMAQNIFTKVGDSVTTCTITRVVCLAYL